MSIEFETHKTIGHCEFCRKAIAAHARGCGDHDWCTDCGETPVENMGDSCEVCKEAETDG